MALMRCALVVCAVIAAGAESLGASVLWTTGAARTVNYDAFYRTGSGFAYISGYFDATMPQRWAAVPFRLDQPARISQLDAYYSNPNGYTTSVAYRIWNRTDFDAPTSLAAIGNLGPYVSVAHEASATSSPSLHLHQHAVDITLPAGDYYLSLYATGQSWIAWWSGGALQDPSLKANAIWRSATYPSPGFQPWVFTGSANSLFDPRDIYNLAFTLHGTNAAGAGDYNLDGAIDGRDLLAWQRALGSNDWRTDGNGDRVVDAGDLAVWQGAMSPPSFHLAHATIPEPSSPALITILALPLASAARKPVRRWRRRGQNPSFHAAVEDFSPTGG
jgi:hypothetical protein